MTARGYRGEIDGLRAIAITSVVAYHVGLPGIPGGFAGVDVFFVISGYLITSLLLKEQQERGSIDLFGFYARRARRLLPAFFVVLFASTIVAGFLLLPLPEEMGNFSRSARFAALYSSNLHFAQSSGGYFDAPTELRPLLHTWSLAVEEQFYFIWPVLLILAFFPARRRYGDRTALIAGMLVAICIASFAMNIHGAGRDGRAGQSAFYMLHSRAWELGIGAALALALPSQRLRPAWVGDLLCAGGLLGIGAAFLMLNANVAYPGTAALLPVLATAGVIAGASLAPGAVLVRGLGARPMVAIGLVSYSWYLWHWPLLAFARVSWLGERDLGRDASLAFLALGLAWLTYAFVESPIRQRRLLGAWNTRKTLGASALLAGMLCVASGALDYRSYSIAMDPTHPMAMIAAATLEALPKRRRCNNGSSLTELRMLEECSTPAPSGKRVVLWGDSHADHVANMVAASASALDIGITVRVRGGCHPTRRMAPGIDDFKQVACAAFNELVLREIELLRSQDLVGVVIAYRWAAMQGKPQISTQRKGDTTAHGSDQLTPQLEMLGASIRQTVNRLTGLGLKVVILGPVPEQRHRGPSCVARRPPQDCSVPRDEQLAYRAEVVGLLESISDENSLVRIADPLDQLCDSNDCPAERNGVVLYKDDDHLSAAGAMGLAPWFGAFVGWLTQADAIPVVTGSP